MQNEFNSQNEKTDELHLNSQPTNDSGSQIKPRKRLVKLSPFFIITGALILVAIITFQIIKSSSCNGWGCLGNALLAIFVIGALVISTYIIWLIFCIILSVRKKRLNQKRWFLPFTIMLSIPITIFLTTFAIPQIIYRIKDYSEHGEFHKTANVLPEIKPYDTASSIPKLNDYKIIGKDISSSELFENNKDYLGEKVLLKGFPEENEVLTYSETGESQSIRGKERTTMIRDSEGKIYSISFIDGGSEFYEDDWKINNGYHNYSYHNYYAYIYGTISTIISKNEKTAVQIIPEKIYYTEDKNIKDYLGLDEKYSTCAQSGNQCTNEEINKGQLVNVSVNNSENIDFYVLKDDGENLTLMSSKILLSEEPINYYKDETLDNFAPSDISKGFTLAPYGSLKILYELTESWNNIPVIQNFEESLNDSYLKIQNGKTILSLNGNAEISIPGLARTRLINIEQDLEAFQQNKKILSMPCTLDFDLSKRAWGVTACSIQTMDLNHNTLSNQEQTNYTYEDLFVKILSSQNDENWPNYTLTENTAEKFDHTHIVPVIEIPKTLINNK